MNPAPSKNDVPKRRSGVNREKRLSRILVTAGPTRERLDSIRFISNFSTGRMGYELATAAKERGYKVTLISGPTGLKVPKGVRFIRIEKAAQMEKELRRNFKGADCLFMASAVGDWRSEGVARGKIKRGPKRLSLRLVQNPDILKKLGEKKGDKILVGFALESRDVIENARRKLREKNLDLIAANRVGNMRSPFGSGRTDVTIIDRNGGLESIANATKKYIAKKLLDRAERIWQERR